MESMLFSAWMIWSTFAAAPPMQMPTPTVLGPKAFLDGDVIELTDVQATSSRLEQGDSLTVRGRFRLESRDEARLALYVTQTAGDGIEEVDRSQTTLLSGLRGEFELKTMIKHRGVLHVTFYDTRSGKPFGGVYFGTPAQMSEIAHWDVSYYLQDGSP